MHSPGGSVGEPQKHWAKGKKPDAEGHIQPEVSRESRAIDRKQISGCRGLGMGEAKTACKGQERMDPGVTEML